MVTDIGIWSNSYCLNTNLGKGSMIECIKAAQKAGFALIIFNPNRNRSNENPTKENELPTKHCITAWKIFMNKSKAQHLSIIAHGNGGSCVDSLLHEFWNEFKSRVHGIALIGSESINANSKEQMDYMSGHVSYYNSKHANGIVHGKQIVVASAYKKCIECTENIVNELNN